MKKIPTHLPQIQIQFLFRLTSLLIFLNVVLVDWLHALLPTRLATTFALSMSVALLVVLRSSSLVSALLPPALILAPRSSTPPISSGKTANLNFVLRSKANVSQMCWSRVDRKASTQIVSNFKSAMHVHSTQPNWAVFKQFLLQI